MKKLILIGGGGHCASCIDIIEELKKYIIHGIIDNNRIEYLDYKYLGNDDMLDSYDIKKYMALITIGQIKNPNKRIIIYNKLKSLGFEIPIIISKKSYVSKKSKIGYGTIVMRDVIINTNSQVGYNCIINNKALIEHGATIGNNSHISTGAIINGDVSIGDNAFIGSGAIINNGIKISNNVIISSGVKVENNIKSNSIIK